MTISCLGFNTITLLDQDQRRSGQRFFDILILFCGDDFPVPRNSPMGDNENI